MDVYALYESLPRSTVAEVARRTGESIPTTTNRLLRKNLDTWQIVSDVLNSLDEKIESASEQIKLLLETRTPQNDGQESL